MLLFGGASIRPLADRGMFLGDAQCKCARGGWGLGRSRVRWSLRTQATADDNSRVDSSPQHISRDQSGFRKDRRHVLLSGAICAVIGIAERSEAYEKPKRGGLGDWSSPGLAGVEDDTAPRFYKTDTGVRVQELRVGVGKAAGPNDTVEVEYVLRRSNGYFIYSTVEGVSFQPRDVPIGPIDLRLGDGSVISGLREVLEGMQPGGKRRALIPPNVGYLEEGLEPQVPTYAAKRQVLNHSQEGLIFEVQLVRIRKRPGMAAS